MMDFLRKIAAFIGIERNSVHAYFATLFAIIIFYVGFSFEKEFVSKAFAGFMAGWVVTSIIAVLFEFAQGVFGIGQASWQDIKEGVVASFVVSALLLFIHLLI